MDKASIGRSRVWRLGFASSWAILIGLLTLSIGHIFKGSSNLFLKALQGLTMELLLPGLIAGMAVSREAHDISLIAAVIANVLIHFVIAWLAFLLLQLVARWFLKVD